MYNVIGDLIMVYSTIFKTKPKKDNKQEFCQRIVSLLNEVEFCIDGHVYNNGEIMLNTMFKYSKLNNGYDSIDDLLNEANEHYKNIVELSTVVTPNIYDEMILVNIDILVNCLYGFKETKDRHFYNQDKAIETFDIVLKAVNQYLLVNGYKLEYNEDAEQVFIVDNEIAIDIEEIDDDKLKSDIISFYNYKNVDDIEEKKKIILILIGKLESRKNEISEKFGSKIADMVGNYANNLNLRHINIKESYKKCYNKSVADLGENELVNWYNYVFAFMMNIYLNLDKVKDININNGYK